MRTPRSQLVLLGLLLGCGLLLGGKAQAAVVQVVEFEHQKRTRQYRVMAPNGHDKSKAVPLVLALHGGGGTAQGFDRSTRDQFSREVDKRGWIVVFPQGLERGWNDGRPVDTLRARRRAGVDDVAFLRTVIERVHASHGIDKTRVYATGISNGGFMSVRLALESSDRIAAIAPVTAQLQKVFDKAKPKHPVGLMVINGTKDPLVPYEGGHVNAFGNKRGAILSTEETISRWRTWNQCTQADKPKTLENRAPLDGTRTTVLRFTPEKQGAEVVLVRVDNGGHTWPGGRQYLPMATIGRVSRDFDAVPMIFDFFARHQRTLPVVTRPKKAEKAVPSGAKGG